MYTKARALGNVYMVPVVNMVISNWPFLLHGIGHDYLSNFTLLH